MTKSNLLGAFLGIAGLLSSAEYAGAQAPLPSSNGLTTPAQSVGLFVFPQKGQTPAVQQQDEINCYAASKQASGVDPAHHRVRSAAVVLPPDQAFKDAANEALSVRAGLAHASV